MGCRLSGRELCVFVVKPSQRWPDYDRVLTSRRGSSPGGPGDRDEQQYDAEPERQLEWKRNAQRTGQRRTGQRRAGRRRAG
jgi:hypothetical protein